MQTILSRVKARLLLVLLFFVLSCNAFSQNLNPVVKTNRGFIRGLTENSILVFKGVPYAAPPLGALRFMPPAEHASWKDTLSATAFGPVAMQATNGKAVGSEDCLTLNVYTPNADNHKRAVVVWVHGGSMTSGTGKGMDGHAFADRDDIVTVTINYRLGVFGFMYLGDADKKYRASANNGVLDCIAALNWIKHNISAFGGDPSRVTLMGESAGAKLISAVSVSPKAKGLFQQFIAESGSVQCIRDTVTAKKIRSRVLSKLHLAETDVTKLIILPADSLISAQAAVCQGVEATSFFGPVNDGVIINNDPYKYAAAKNLPHFKALLGTNKTEATLFAATDSRITDPDSLFFRKCFGFPYPIVYRAYLKEKTTKNGNDAAINIFTQYMYQMHTYRWAKALVNNGIPVWMYRFDYAGGRFGAGHAMELQYVWYNPASNLDAEKRQLALNMHGAWVAFIKTGNPNTKGLPLWSNYHNNDKKVMLFDATSKMTTIKQVFDDKDFPSSVFVLKN